MKRISCWWECLFWFVVMKWLPMFCSINYMPMFTITFVGVFALLHSERHNLFWLEIINKKDHQSHGGQSYTLKKRQDYLAAKAFICWANTSSKAQSLFQHLPIKHQQSDWLMVFHNVFIQTISKPFLSAMVLPLFFKCQLASRLSK